MIIDIELIISLMRQVADKDKVDPIDTVHNEATITLEELLRFAQAISKYTQDNQQPALKSNLNRRSVIKEHET